MPKAKETIAVPEAGALATLQESMAEEAMGFNPRSVVVKILHQEAMFSIPGLPPTKRLEGIILASRRVRIFYPHMGQDADTEKILTFTSNRPFCASSNYATGTIVDADFDSLKDDDIARFIKDKIAEGGGTCADCPFGGQNAWGSVELLGKTGKGKACSDLRRLLFWRPGIKIPIIISVPTTSIKNWDMYCSSLEAGKLKHNELLTEMDLAIKETPGRKFSIMSFNAVDPKDGMITEEMAEELLVQQAGIDGEQMTLYQVLISIFKGRELSTDEYPDNGSTKEVVDDDL